MQWPNIQDLPYEPDEYLSDKQIDEVIEYCINDVLATEQLYEITKGKIKLREIFGKKYNLNLINANDPEIGSEIILDLYCKKAQADKSEILSKRTYRKSIKISECIFDYVQFNSEEFNDLLDKFRKTIIYNTKDDFKESTSYKGFTYDYGTGGIHGSIKSGVYKSDDEYIIYDWDVASLYPSLAIVNNLYPEHLGKIFLNVYSNDIVETRFKHKKLGKSKDLTEKEREFNMIISDGLKLGANGSYGKSNDEYSYLYDPKFTMSITINGQLLLSMLAESLVDNISDITILQINTDGLTIKIPRSEEGNMFSLCKQWEEKTKLTLEYVVYKQMIIKDVNNYIAENINGDIKHKGCFEIDKKIGSELALHKNNSMKIIPIALENYFIRNIPIERTIRGHKDIYDFCIGKRNKNSEKSGESSFYLLNAEDKTKLTKTIRYFMTTKPMDSSCGQLIKEYQNGRQIRLEVHPQKGRMYKSQLFNTYYYSDNYQIDYSYYERECRKIIDTIEDNQLKLF